MCVDLIQSALSCLQHSSDCVRHAEKVHMVLNVQTNHRLIRDEEKGGSRYGGDDDDVGLSVLGCRADILGTNCNKLKTKNEYFGSVRFGCAA